VGPHALACSSGVEISEVTGRLTGMAHLTPASSQWKHCGTTAAPEERLHCFFLFSPVPKMDSKLYLQQSRGAS
jgi:hypothetical protein